jgi:hypothetical protein
MLSSVWRRSLAYWEARLAHHEAQASITHELVPIWRWLPAIPVPRHSVADLLARTIAHASLGWEIDQTIEFLATSAEAYPRDATRLLAELGAHASQQLRAAFHVGSTETILKTALHSGDPDAVEFARTFINDVADKGDTGFYHLLSQDAR